jgi:hypothetical protein
MGCNINTIIDNNNIIHLVVITSVTTISLLFGYLLELTGLYMRRIRYLRNDPGVFPGATVNYAQYGYQRDSVVSMSALQVHYQNEAWLSSVLQKAIICWWRKIRHRWDH